ncbi:crotonase/enoyl-CoA hydratase family protein [Streptomonospora wellingtoniae]|uniref:Crotonase/enoyl-CoA hydratase family protein n=1 Tax=Streptomonospora wellingtoniae TaxID=3075544 RepID=A0ABU2KYE8_9ACTN|nr:crotonase/enoyl-CoA hydratase family protein [Streptomonospora sp. DSM 45055]MDT0304334.1 crotonase/enoyl-CoA hydratase family protein [Streptomonospora sp. DSM 45055]
MSDEVGFTAEDGVAVITINRPQAKNAVNAAVAQGVADALDELDSRKDLVAGVLTGAGQTFCSGMDLKAFMQGEVPTVEGRGFAGFAQRPPRKPLVAAVEGYALAGGFEAVLACDLVVAAEDATFGIPEVKRGLVAGGGGLLRLQHRIPRNIAMEFALTGDFVKAPRMAELGLVNRVTAPGVALEGARELAGRIAANAPMAVAVSKRVIGESGDWASGEMWQRQDEIAGPVFVSHDAMEGAAAFAEKREPRWKGE